MASVWRYTWAHTTLSSPWEQIFPPTRLSTWVFSPVQLRKAHSPGVLWFFLCWCSFELHAHENDSNATVQHVIKHRQHNRRSETYRIVYHARRPCLESTLQFPSISSMFKANAAWWVRRDSNPTNSNSLLSHFHRQYSHFLTIRKVRQATKWGDSSPAGRADCPWVILRDDLICKVCWR